ncbi:MAG: hypothetical protein U9Q12_01390, partial [Patescibacteria group bacterium]|nr:hypothetical protein [Patescibacteria group bacterium]
GPYCGDFIVNGPEQCDGSVGCASDCTWLPGECGTAVMSYKYLRDDWDYTKKLCTLGTPSITQEKSTFPVIDATKNPLENATKSWKCSTVGGDSGDCTVTLTPPTLSCVKNKSESSTAPTIPLCTSSDGRFMNPTPKVEVGTPHKQWGWDCIHNDFPSQLTFHCTAPLPGAKCGIADNATVINIKPSSNLCGASSQLIDPPAVTLQTDGWWQWGCEYNGGGQADPLVAGPCRAPTCITNDPIDATSPIMLSEDMKSRISLSCPNLCCSIESIPDGTTNVTDHITVCSNNSKDIKIVGGVNNLPAECWFEDNGNEDCDSTTEVCVPVNGGSVSTACMESQCTASGTCAKAPRIAADKTACKSSCNSNADCSSGRMIETKP